MKKDYTDFVIALFGFVFISSSACLAQKSEPESPSFLFYKGNHLYQQAQYDEAIASYNLILAQGLESGPLYYNIGNSYFKKGELGRAILNYERARAFIPRDSDLKSNYEYARSLIKGSPSGVRKNVLFRALKGPFGLLSIDGLALFLCFMNSLLVVSLALRIFSRSFRRYSIYLIVICGVIFSSGLATFLERIGHAGKDAVIVASETEAQFEPLDNSTTYFTLYEGAKVATLASNGSYSKIRRPDGKMGWVKREYLERI